jgi:hypothetical protein
MRTFKLTNGYIVNTRTFPEFTEFETLNPEGEVISVVVLKDDAADDLMTNLRIIDGLKAV